jgi:hypothetical protein
VIQILTKKLIIITDLLHGWNLTKTPPPTPQEENLLT